LRLQADVLLQLGQGIQEQQREHCVGCNAAQDNNKVAQQQTEFTVTVNGLKELHDRIKARHVVLYQTPPS
jgi:hypothetical protein